MQTINAQAHIADLASQTESLRPWVELETGMDFSGNRFTRLCDAVAKVLSQPIAPLASDCTSESLANASRDPGKFIERLIAELTVGESYFFRNEHHFRALREQVIPQIVRENSDSRVIRVWSAGCATGEEPYSIAILLDELMGSRPILHKPSTAQASDWSFSILGTDLNPDFLDRARIASYRPWSFRLTKVHEDRNYFAKEGDTYCVVPRVRDRVRFAFLNLGKDVYPSPVTGTLGLDLIVFRNVAIYLRPEVTGAIIERFCRALRPGGWLLLGETELNLVPNKGFAVQRFEQATFYRKTGDGSAVGDEFLSPPPLPVLATVALAARAEMGIHVETTVPALPEWVPLPKRARNLQTATPGESSRGLYRDSTATWQEIERLVENRQWDQAERTMGRVTENQQRAQIRLRYVQLLLSKAEVVRARNMLSICLTEDPMLIEAQFLQCSFALEAGDLEGAEQACRRALYVDRHCPMAHFHLALIQKQRGDQAGSERGLRTTLKLAEGKDPHGLVQYGEGVCYGRLKEMAKALLGFSH